MEAVPLQIMASNPQDKTIIVNESVLRSLLMKREIRDKYISVISINGVFRQGKSFLLNFFLCYLRQKYVEKVNVIDWLESLDSLPKGFAWAPGSRRHTTGIYVWSEIFIARIPTGEEVAILLVDTQGAFDNQSPLSDCAAVFSLSTLMSSVQIYNVMRNIKHYDLTHLQGFGGYGNLISNNPGEAPFQNLCFLVRDWACPYEKAYGKMGGDALLEEVFSGGDEVENKTLADDVKALYDKISCYLLPYPGRIVDASAEFDGKLEDVDVLFKYYVKDFVESMVAPENIVVKTIKGQKIKAGDLVLYIAEYGRVLRDGQLPKMDVVFKATVEAHHKAAAFNALKIYKKIMDSDCRYSPRRYNHQELFHKHSMTKLKAVDHYGKIKRFEDVQINDKYLLELKNNMDEEFKEYRKINEQRVREREEIDRGLRAMQERARRERERGLRTTNAQAAGTAAAVVGGIAVMAFGISKLFSSTSRGAVAEKLISDVAPVADEHLDLQLLPPIKKNTLEWFNFWGES